ncbi:MAG: TRAP transporter substrate-binding protein [Planctomycetota bacterium]|jgi:tripartite ATP-independent transporter DctP family solute receptor
MKKITVLILLLLSISVLVNGCGKTEKGNKIILKVASVLPADHPSSEALEFFSKRLAEISKGKIEVRLFLNSQLGKESETIEMCQAGNLEMVFMSVAPLTQFIPELNALSMPFIFRDSQHMYKVVDGPIGKHFSQKLNAINLETLCFFDSGSRNIMTKKGPINRPEDLKGMKIRVMSAPLMVATIEALGASAIPMNQGEVYTALQTGVLDGWENNPPTTLSFKMYETGCIYYAHTKHLMVSDLLLINRKLYEALDDQTRAYINTVAKEATLKQRELWQQSEQKTIKKLEELGMKFNKVDKTIFSQRVDNVYEDCYKKYGDEFKRICEQIKSTR